MKAKEKISLLLALAMLLPTLAACSESADNADGTDVSETEGETAQTPADESESEETEEEKILPNLPEVKYNGADFNIYCSSNAEYGGVKDDFTATEYTGEPINDARYTRNLAVEQKYEVKINCYPAESAGSGTGTSKIRTSVTSGDYAYDIAMLCGFSTSELARDDMLADIKTVEYIDLSMPWWDQRANTDLAVAGKIFYTTGDISTADNEATYCIMYNKNMADELQMTENPYDMVREGTWTIDNFGSMVEGVSQDLDGNGEYDSNDRYGVLIWDDSIMGVVNGAGIKCCDIDENGDLYLNLYSEKTVNALEKYFTFALNKQVSYGYQRYNWDDKLLVTMFQNNQALFIQQLLQLIPKLREMDADFGILPYYKYDENQETYYNTVGSWHSVFMCLPKVQQDIERTGVITEALAAESKYTVTPAYYEVTLKEKVSRDRDSSEMLDIIFETRCYDLGWYYSVGNFGGVLMDLFRNYNDDFTSSYTKTEKLANKTLEKINQSFDKLD